MNRLFYLLGLVTALIAVALVRQACCPKSCCQDDRGDWNEEEYDPYRQASGDPGLCDQGIAD